MTYTLHCMQLIQEHCTSLHLMISAIIDQEHGRSSTVNEYSQLQAAPDVQHNADKVATGKVQHAAAAEPKWLQKNWLCRLCR